MTENSTHAERVHSTEPAEGAEPDEVAVPDKELREHSDQHAEGDDDD